MTSAALRAQNTKKHHKKVFYYAEPSDACSFVLSLLKPGDIFITMGAGDNWKLVYSKKWEDKETCSVTSLKRSTEYKITVRPYTMDEIFSKHRLAYSTNFGCIVLLPVQTIGGGLKLDGMGLETYDNSTCKPTPDEFKWDELPTWTVSSTSAGIMTCSK